MSLDQQKAEKAGNTNYAVSLVCRGCMQAGMPYTRTQNSDSIETDGVGDAPPSLSRRSTASIIIIVRLLFIGAAP